DDPGRGVGDADVADLPGAYGVVEGAHGLGHGGVPVPHVHPVQVDVVGPEAAQALLQRQDEVLAVVAGGVRVGGVAGDGVLGGEDEAVPASGEQFADDAFASAVAVEVRRVDHVAAGVGVVVEDSPGVRFGQAARGAVGHRAEEEFGDAQAGIAQ